MNDESRARSGSLEGWDRARGAYLAVLGDHDPGSSLLADGARDLRLGHAEPLELTASTTLVSGPNDLVELREVVESALGVGTWPSAVDPGGEAIRVEIEVERPAALLALLVAMEGLIEKRSPWGRWRTVVDTMAARVSSLDRLTVDLRVLHPTT